MGLQGSPSAALLGVSRCGCVGVGTHVPDKDPEAQGRVLTLERISLLGFINAGLQGPEQWGARSLASQALRENEASDSDKRQSDVDTKLPRDRPSSSADRPLLCAAR